MPQASALSVAHRTQRSSHSELFCARTFNSTATWTPSARIDAVVVPASRGAAALDGAASLATRLNAPLVALCSKRTSAHGVVARFARLPGCHVLAIDVPDGYRHDLLPTRTVADRFRDASGRRNSDLSVKRNLGLLLARLQNWSKIIFVDDDVAESTDGRTPGLPTETVRRLASALDSHQIAGLVCRDFPDNSVVCHARRLAGFEQDVFVSGAALAVNCDDHPLPFFPDQYNEDWFFFSRRVAARDLAYVGDTTQAVFDPFESPDRARHEEFGDLLAEGLFGLFTEQPEEMGYLNRLAAADTEYWSQFIDARRDTLSITAMALEFAYEVGVHDVARITGAINSLVAADDQLARLSPDLCVDYLDAWAADLIEWERATQRLYSVGSTAAALNFLELCVSTI
jgi:hypothetical protein